MEQDQFYLLYRTGTAMPPVSYTFMCPGEASPNKNIQQITKINELSVMRAEKTHHASVLEHIGMQKLP